MTPSVEPTTITAPGLTVVPARLLDGGEVVILAVKPSAWFCLLVSLPVLLTAAAFTAAGYLAARVWSGPLQPTAIALFWAGVSIVRLVVAYLQWLARLYVLTNRRVLRVSGLFREAVHTCLLRHVARAEVSVSPAERVLGVGSLSFQSSDPAARQAHWAHINYPAEVQQIVAEAISRAR
jgi:hypothetical protein